MTNSDPEGSRPSRPDGESRNSLERTIARSPGRSSATEDEPPERIGPYRILERIGKGGMGVVYLAEQEEPVRRRVAIKFLRLGTDSPDMLARFDTERQALACMSHPNIATVFDAGTIEGGRPYLLMEYVPGVPITDYCDENCLSTRDRLELFLSVLNGVQHAHQNGIIHRDIKPSNVLVMLQDGHPVAKIIDFGVAKIVARRQAHGSLETRHDQIVGTLAYMSPEQAASSPLDIDTRTDIYALGVLLYELLVGGLPFDTDVHPAAGRGDRRTDTEPQRPSERITTLSDSSKVIARRRRTDPKSLAKELRGDLDWITLKAVEVDRTHRYPTASEFAADIVRHLQGEPVVAGPHGAAYRFKKLAKKYKGPVVAAAAVLVALVLGLVVSLRLYLKAELARSETSDALREANDARGREARALDLAQEELGRALHAEKVAKRNEELAEAAREEANQEAEARRQEAARARQIRDVFVGMMLLAVEPSREGPGVKVIDVLDKFAGSLDADPPEEEAYLRGTLGKAYYELGKYEPAERQLKRAVSLHEIVEGRDSPEVLEAQNDLAAVWFQQLRWSEAATLLKHVLEREREVLGREDRRTLETMNNLAEVYRQQDRLEDADRLLSELVATRERVLPEDDPATLNAKNTRACLLENMKRLPEARKLFEYVLDRRRRTLSPLHPDTLTSMHNLGHLLVQEDDTFDEGLNLLRAAYDNRRSVEGESHSRTLESGRMLAAALSSAGRPSDAETVYRRCESVCRAAKPELDPDRIDAVAGLARFLNERRAWEESGKLYGEAREACARRGDGPTLFVLQITTGHAECLVELKRFEEAEKDLEDVFGRVRSASDRESRDLSDETCRALVRLYDAWGKPDQLARYKALLPPEPRRP